jgi:hypothetical protein
MFWLRHLILKTIFSVIILPRQARDKHSIGKAALKKRDDALCCSQGGGA